MNSPKPYFSRSFPNRASLQSSAFAPALFSGGEGGRRPDEGAVALEPISTEQTMTALQGLEVVKNEWRDPHYRDPHYSHFRPYLASLQSSAFSPALLSGGEGGRRPDEGALYPNVIRAVARFSARLKRGGVDRAAHSLPPHPAFGHLLPPQKARGEKALEVRELQERGRVAANKVPRVCELRGRRRSV